MDKRIVRTRRAILVSVLEQTKDKDLNEVRVVKVCEDAGINKSTFYLHYKSIDECVKAILENLVLSVANFAATVNCQQAHINPSTVVNDIINQITTNQDIIEKFKHSRLAGPITERLQKTAIETICVNNNIQPGTVDFARVSLSVYAVTGVVLNADVKNNKDIIFAALSDMIRKY
ncbi:TetR/AcrR family transcriptional regulator [uncultured Eubacterium sp.]|uniref:TetR/AcrR family transcriptional regulator n=1 Tax=uncultured Eubacterium sp. TaxID=165185 RepID=UPI0025FAEFD7|nr:TetR/AcrR family transcriptional regulator [uncultured Eubacterium sp.]